MTPISVDWLTQNGWHKLDKHERQPTDHYRRCLGMETVDLKFMVSAEDLCIDICLFTEADTRWMCWITKAHGPRSFPAVWIHVRTFRYSEELVLLYEGLTGRKYTPEPFWKKRDVEPLFVEPQP